ncbi:MAG TPA: hypothetical protein VGN34_08385 [Ktedonobacteraceae bacterium]
MQDTVCHLQQVAAQSKLIGLVTITFQFEHEGHGLLPARRLRSIQHFLENLRSLVRKTDEVLQLDQTCYFLLRGANQQGAGIVQERLWEALLWAVHNISDKELRQPWSIETGYSAYPGTYTTFEQSLRAAHEPTQRFILQAEKTVQKVTSSTYINQSGKKGELSLFARQLGIPYLPLLPHKLATRVQHLISPQLAQELHCYPVGRERDILTVAMANPQDKQAIERLQRETGLRIFPVLTHPQELQSALENWQ